MFFTGRPSQTSWAHLQFTVQAVLPSGAANAAAGTALGFWREEQSHRAAACQLVPTTECVCLCVCLSVCLCAPDTATGTFRLGLRQTLLECDLILPWQKWVGTTKVCKSQYIYLNSNNKKLFKSQQCYRGHYKGFRKVKVRVSLHQDHGTAALFPQIQQSGSVLNQLEISWPLPKHLIY